MSLIKGELFSYSLNPPLYFVPLFPEGMPLAQKGDQGGFLTTIHKIGPTVMSQCRKSFHGPNICQTLIKKN